LRPLVSVLFMAEVEVVFEDAWVKPDEVEVSCEDSVDVFKEPFVRDFEPISVSEEVLELMLHAAAELAKSSNLTVLVLKRLFLGADEAP